MHSWGDDWFEKHGDDLYTAIHECSRIWTRYGRIGTHSKEKWGSFRDQLWPWDGTVTSLLYPGYVRIMTPRWFYWHVDWKVIRPVLKWSRLSRLVFWWQAQVYNYAIQRACKKYPAIVDELTIYLDGYKMIKPGIFGPLDGQKINDDNWTRL